MLLPRPGRSCDETRLRQDGPFPEVIRRSHGEPRIADMESVATLLIVIFQLFFGWCGEEPKDSPPPARCETSGDC